MSEVEAEIDKKPEVIHEEGPWSKYLLGGNAAKLLSKRFFKVNSLFGIYYLTQFILAISAANFYSDEDRFLSCGVKDLTTPGDATKVLDKPLYLLAIFHITEWLRATLLLLISCVGSNLTIVWYITMLNSIYGIIAYIFCYVTYFSESGQACIGTQKWRGQFLLAEIILFWIWFLPMIWPLMVLLMCSKQSHEQILNAKDDDEEEED
jgi:hypothetical protein